MKKFFTTEKYKKKNLQRAKRSLKRKLVFKKYQKQKNKSELNLPIPERTYKRKFEIEHKDFVKIKAPEKLSFIDYPEQFSNFIEKLKLQFEKKNKVFIKLRDVTEISYGAIVVLLSILVKFKSNKIDFDGDFPNDTKANQILIESGFFKYLFSRFNEEDRYLLNKSSIHTHAWKNVDSELSSKLIKEATKTIWNEERRCQGVQRTLIELMQNTNNHAVIDKEGEKHWWVSVHHDKANKIVRFSFIDFGVGVFNSLNHKTKDSKWYNWQDKLKKKFGYSNNAELLRLILEGKLHKSVTEKYYRGKGLPGIKEAQERNQLSNLHIITNNTFARIDKNEYKSLINSFSGTFVYWEINENNISCDGINKNNNW